MSYLGIDQHARQITISLRDESGDVVLAQRVYKVLRKDGRLREWFKRIKRSRGATIARVAVMRKLTTFIWHMLTKQKTYAECRAVIAA